MAVNTLIYEPDRFSDLARSTLEKVGQVYTRDCDFDVDEIDAIFVRLSHYIGPSFISPFSNLKYIISPTTGRNHIDLDALSVRNIRYLSLAGETDFLKTIRATSELTLAITMALMRNVVGAANHVNSGFWSRDPWIGREINSSNVLLLGLGRIGSHMREIYKSLGANVRFFDPSDELNSMEGFVSLRDGLPWADIVSVHVNWSEDKTGIYDSTFFQSMKRSAFFINTSRGELVDETALLMALECRQISGAAIDVINNENAFEKSELFRNRKRFGERLLLTPHIGGLTFESLEAVEQFLAERLLEEISSGVGGK